MSAGTAERHPPEDVPVSDSVSVTGAWVLSVSAETVSEAVCAGAAVKTYLKRPPGAVSPLE